ncbi:MAG: hypothetical protein GXO21_07505, partial [Aquificae bacterium]|nr:hypothetical protein [Aquificota bacterium]
FFTGENLEEFLNLSVKDYIASSEIVLVPEKKQILLPEFIKWHSDIYPDVKVITNFLKSFFKNAKKEQLKEVDNIIFLHYDWFINSLDNF